MAGGRALSKASGVPKSAIDDVFSAIVRLTRKGKRVSIRGFGTFYAHLHRGRTQITPLVQGGKVTYSDRLVLKFKPSLSAKQRMNLPGHAKGSRPKGKK